MAVPRREVAHVQDQADPREYSSEHYTYLHDPDGSMIEPTYHPLGMEDSRGNKVEVMRGGLR